MRNQKVEMVFYHTMMEYFTDLAAWQLVQNDDSLIVLCVMQGLREIRKKEVETEILIGLNSRLQNSCLTYEVRFVRSLVKIKEGKTPIRTLGEYGHEEFNGACAFFDISGFSKLASRLGKREKEESKKRH